MAFTPANETPPFYTSLSLLQHMITFYRARASGAPHDGPGVYPHKNLPQEGLKNVSSEKRILFLESKEDRVYKYFK